jgi:hypothetical protein
MFVKPLLQWKSNKYYTFWVWDCSLRYPACNVQHITQCHLWPVKVYIFSHYLINGMIFKKKVIEHKMCVFLIFSMFVWNISHSKKNWVRYDQKPYIGLHVKYPLFLSEFNETWIFWRIFEKYFNIKFQEIHPVGAELFQMDSHDKANSHFSQFCKFAWKLSEF